MIAYLHDAWRSFACSFKNNWEYAVIGSVLSAAFQYGLWRIVSAIHEACAR